MPRILSHGRAEFVPDSIRPVVPAAPAADNVIHLIPRAYPEVARAAAELKQGLASLDDDAQCALTEQLRDFLASRGGDQDTF